MKIILNAVGFELETFGFRGRCSEHETNEKAANFT